MEWIARQYGMKMPPDFITPGYCDPAIEPGTGDPSDRDKTEDCYTSTPFTNTIQNRKCDFALTKETFGVDKCVKSSTDGFEGLRFVCVTKDQSNGKIRTESCSNNCKGVEESAIAIASTIITAASAITGSQMLAPFTMAAGALLGNTYMNSFPCTTPDCRCRNRLLRRNCKKRAKLEEQDIERIGSKDDPKEDTGFFSKLFKIFF